MKALKRCPFCGSNPETVLGLRYDSEGRYYLVFEIACKNCDIHKTAMVRDEGNGITFENIEDTMLAVADKWNVRLGLKY